MADTQNTFSHLTILPSLELSFLFPPQTASNARRFYLFAGADAGTEGPPQFEPQEGIYVHKKT